MKKIRVGILFGGRSAEHEVSLQSAKNVIEAIDKSKYDIFLVGIDKQGHWLAADSAKFLLNADNPKQIELNKKVCQEIAVIPGEAEKQLQPTSKEETSFGVDVIFPILHGPFGEDGTMQGLLKLAGIPFIGAGVLGSAVGMDKDVMKRLFREAGFPIGKFLTFRREDRARCVFEQIEKQLGLPFFIKPANLGSSVGVAKIKDKKSFDTATEEAFSFDNKIIYEENLPGREIEVAVLGNEHPIASVPGEIIPHHDFYSYEAKYIDSTGAGLEVPAKLPQNLVAEFQSMAIKVFKVLECEGMGRVDFFLVDQKKIYVNEINTIPGFTKISMYPRLWAETGIPYTKLIDELINLALARHERDKKLRVSAN